MAECGEDGDVSVISRFLSPIKSFFGGFKRMASSRNREVHTCCDSEQFSIAALFQNSSVFYYWIVTNFDGFEDGWT